MKRIILILLFIFLFSMSGISVAEEFILHYPGDDQRGDPYDLVVYDNNFRITGFNTNFPESNVHLEDPLYGAMSYYIEATAENAMEMAARNAWIAMLLAVKTTGKIVAIWYSSDSGEITRITYPGE